MSTRSSIRALAVAGLAAAALAPTVASAKPTMKPIPGIIINHPIPGIPVTPKPVLGVVVHPPHPIMGIVIPPHPDPDPPHMVWWHHHHHFPWVIEEETPVQATAPVIAGSTVHASTAVASPSGPCTCLTKSYVEGGVLFNDICTREAAFATADELKAQMQGSLQGTGQGATQ